MNATRRNRDRGPRGLDPETGLPLIGLLNVDKPLRISSMGVVSVVRGRACGARTGHAGTLDPLATGVLLVCIGKPATRAVDRFMRMSKRYLAEIDLSAFTSTDDAEGERTEVAPSDPVAAGDRVPSPRQIDEAITLWTGEVMQAPPAFSAIKVGGRRAYRMARGGDEVSLPPRPVQIHSIRVLAYDWPRLTIDVHCGKGTYIRSLARDLGRSLGVGGSLLALRRTAIGPYRIDDAVRLDEVPAPLLQRHLLPLPLESTDEAETD